MATVHIIGAGVSGLAAATQLAAAHVPVKLYEAGTRAGGRAGQDHLHVFSGAAYELQQFIARIEAKHHFMRLPRTLTVSDAASGESWNISRRRPFLNAPLLDQLRLVGTALRPDHAAAAAMLPEFSPLQDAILNPLSRLALSNPSHRATAKQMQRLLRRQFRRGGTKFYMAKHSLQQGLIAPALTMLEYLGGSVYFGQALKGLDFAGDGVSHLHFARKKLLLEPEDVVILATPAHVTKNLVNELQAPAEQHCAITFTFPVEHREAAGVRVLANAPADLLRYEENRIAACIRLAGHAWASDEAALAARVWKTIRTLHPYLGALPEWSSCREKRAGHVPLPQKLPKTTLPPRCLLAGDWLDATRAGTLEVAAQNGHRAAEQALLLVGKTGPSQSSFYLN